MMNKENYRDILRVEFQSRKARNQYYSLRAFAQSLGIGSGALSEILKGKRNLGINKAKAIVDKLNFDENEKENFLNSVLEVRPTPKKNQDNEMRELSAEIFEIVSSPTCMSILALADIDNFRLDIEWMSLKLGIKQKDIAHALKLMREVGLLEVVNGIEQICEDFVFSPDGIPSRAIKNYHHQMLEKAANAIEEQAVNKRDISGISFAVDVEDLPKLKKDIINFQKRMIKKYSEGKKDEVYHLEMALFALSNEGV
jgi:uncharacterized protein (TIGR02147 family)